MHLDDIGYSVAVVQGFLVGEIKVDGDTKVAADDDDTRQGEVEGEKGDDKRETLAFHLSPGERAGQAKGFRAVPSPAQDGEQSPDQTVEPGPYAHDLHCLPADFLNCRVEEKGWLFSCLSYLSTLYCTSWTDGW